MFGSELLIKAALTFLFLLPAGIIGQQANSALAEVALASAALTAVIVLWRKGLKPLLSGVDRMHTMYEAIMGASDKPGLLDQVSHIESNQETAAARLAEGDTLLRTISEDVGSVRGGLDVLGQRTATVEGRLDTLAPIVEAMAGDRREAPRRTTPDRRTA